MSGIRLLIDKPRARRMNVRRFIDTVVQHHPELRTQVTLEGFYQMAERDGIHVRLATLPPKQRARTFAVGRHQFIRLNREMAPGERALQGMHELCHIWRDRPISGAYYSDELTGGEPCEFADLFAWYVTSTARPFFDPSSNQARLRDRVGGDVSCG